MARVYVRELHGILCAHAYCIIGYVIRARTCVICAHASVFITFLCRCYIGILTVKHLEDKKHEMAGPFVTQANRFTADLEKSLPEAHWNSIKDRLAVRKGMDDPTYQSFRYVFVCFACESRELMHLLQHIHELVL